MSNTKIHNINEDTENKSEEDNNYASNESPPYSFSRKNSVFDTIISHSAVPVSNTPLTLPTKHLV